MQRRLKPQMNADEHRLGPNLKGEAALDVSVLSVFICVHLWFVPLRVLNCQLNRREG
jgi:hypothetical protein